MHRCHLSYKLWQLGFYVTKESNIFGMKSASRELVQTTLSFICRLGCLCNADMTKVYTTNRTFVIATDINVSLPLQLIAYHICNANRANRLPHYHLNANTCILVNFTDS